MPVQDTNNFVITGIPRGGTSLACNLINHVQNIVCFNEVPALYNVDELMHSFHHLRSMLRYGKPVPIRVSSSNHREITDTQSEEHDVAKMVVAVDEKKPLAVGSKINVPYLFQIEKILSYKYDVLAIIRNPVYAIASWNKYPNINEQYVMDEDFEKWNRYKDFKFKTNERFARQAELYNHFISILRHYDIMPTTYEIMVRQPKQTIEYVTRGLGIEFKLKKELPKLENLNRDSRFQGIDLDAIRDAVEKQCPWGKKLYDI